MKWIEKYKVPYYFTDHNKQVKLAYLDRYMQETANRALKNLGPDPKDLAERDLAFLLSKISFKFYAPLREDDEITASTWAEPSKGASFTRNYTLHCGDELIAEAASLWALVNVSERKLLKQSDLEGFGLEEEWVEAETLGFSVPRRFRLPAELPYIDSYRVKYSDLDENKHMNNTRYIDLICDVIEMYNDKLSLKKITSLDVNHANEVKFNEIIDIYISMEENNKYYIKAKIKASDLTCFEAMASL